MEYQVLARKYRPRTFEDMVGQAPILRILGNALKQQRIHHAYLFTGTRGVGKTTLARILAKCLNCETGITSTPCGTCSTCKAVDSGQFLDLYEIDAASRTKVEDTRELLDNVLYPPSQGRYKVYLIDEVHMLSNHSFNALLKTLEEPPEHVKFLLATTDPKKLPITILSRCLQFHLKRILPEQIAAHLETICKAEAVPYESSALEKLAKAADGSMRDALSLLDQAIAFCQGNVNKQDVEAMIGSIQQEELLPLLDALANRDGKALLEQVARIAELTPDFQQVLEELISLFHRIAVAQIVPDANLINTDDAALFNRFSAEDIQLYYQITLLGRRDLAICPSPQQGFEMTMLRLLAFKPELQANAPKIAAVTNTAPSKPPATKVAEPVKEMPQTSNVSAAFDWRDILPKLELSGMAYALASNCVLSRYEGNKILLTLSQNHQPMLNPKLKERLADALSRQLNKPIQLDIQATAEELNTPLKQTQHENAAELANAKQAVLQDPKVQQLIDMYDATVEVELIGK